MRPTERSGEPMSIDAYLAWEEQNTIKHEYVAGEVFAMSGVTARHNLITLNLVRALHSLVRPRGCRVFATDVKLRAAIDRIYYPDVIVACGAADDVEPIVEEPSLLVEVTSPSTRATDRREKLDAYMRLPSLRAYLLVEQRRRHALIYRRDARSGWVREEIESGDIELAFFDAGLAMDEIYDDVPLPPIGVGEPEEDDWADDYQ